MSLLKAPNLVLEDLNIVLEDRVKLVFSFDNLSEKKKNLEF